MVRSPRWWRLFSIHEQSTPRGWTQTVVHGMRQVIVSSSAEEAISFARTHSPLASARAST